MTRNMFNAEARLERSKKSRMELLLEADEGRKAVKGVSCALLVKFWQRMACNCQNLPMLFTHYYTKVVENTAIL